ncbi:adhesion G protein-coupled receptor E1 isoform X3 [Dermochelys coriacea]|uniref:adhesion G protein-coupled receptor E1 isoform X3 n=1 Tax=Dermochelys coriacea TaxID=27794 RepID=UPI001CA89AA4|nr:adhesion G protein-coupled receptor E1 isoform X3 [Dermochelys coriacea]
MEDMCAASSVCPAFATCENIPGSHRCACKRGFASSSGEQYFTDRKVKCNDIDECSLDPSLCGPSTVCTNKLGSYACKCPPGYLPPSQPGIPFSCTDINECLDLASCPASATCTNTPGSHFCTCNTGFASSSGELRFTEPAAQCNDIDECSRDPSPCGPSSVCTNTLGSYACTCPPGYLPPSQPGIPFNCTDVDECAPNPAICGPNASCINTPGSYTCQCSPGHLPSTPGPWVPGTTRCTDVASNDPVRKCHNRRLDAAHGSSPDNAAFCTLLTSTFSVLGDPYERKNSTISLVKAAAGFASILEQTPSWSNLSTEQLSTMATVFLQSVESIVLAAFANPAGNGSQTIQMEQLDVQTKVIEDGCPRKDSVISLEVKGETMKISCRTIQGTVARGTSPPPEGVRWISQACFSAAPFRMGMGSPSPHHQVAILHSPGWSGVCLLRGHGVHPEWQLLPWPKGHLSLDEFQGGECRPDQPDQDRFPGSSQLHLPEHHAKQQPRPAHLRLVGGHGLAWQLGSGRVRGPTQQCHSHHVQLQSRLQLGCPHGIGGDNGFPLFLVSHIGLALSLLCLFLAILTFLLSRSIRNVNTSIHLQLCLCLFLADLLFLTAVDSPGHQLACTIIAGLLHYLFLACFAWMFLEAVVLFLTIRNLGVVNYFSTHSPKMRHLSLFGYGFPTLVVAVSAVVMPEGYGRQENCWLSMEKGFIWSFLGPVCVIIGINSILFALTLWMLQRKLSRLNTDVSTLKDTRLLTFKAIAQVFILGCTWIFGLLQVGPVATVMAYLFTIINSLQGAFIFLVHCLLNRQVREEYKRWFTCKPKSYISDVSMSTLATSSKAG